MKYLPRLQTADVDCICLPTSPVHGDFYICTQDRFPRIGEQQVASVELNLESGVHFQQ
jgi:hypothetical protein